MLLPLLSLITPSEISSMLPAPLNFDDVEIVLPCLSLTEPVASIDTPPAAPLPVLALEMELPESILSVPRLNCTKPAAADVKDAAETAPPFWRSEERRVGKECRPRLQRSPYAHTRAAVE